MKKTIVLSVLTVGLMISPLLAFAAVDCSVTPSDPSCHIVGGADPNTLTQVWGLTGYQTPHVAAGETIPADQYGYSEGICPSWYPKGANGGCQVLVSTDYYRNSMNVLAKGLISVYGSKAQAVQMSPMFSGWINAQ